MTMIHTIIRGLILYRVETKYSTNNKIIKINQITNIQVLNVHIMSNTLLFHIYIKVNTTIMANITAIINGIIFELLWNIEKNLHITKKNIVQQNKNNTIEMERIIISVKINYKLFKFFSFSIKLAIALHLCETLFFSSSVACQKLFCKSSEKKRQS
jgi:hypothetical protein